MKHLLFLLSFWSCLCTAHHAQAQTECISTPKVLTTNPDNPVNTEFSIKKNTFFDWRNEVFKFKSFYYPNPPFQTDVIVSPFYNQYYQNQQMGAIFFQKDMKPSDGWELLKVQLGYKDENLNVPVEDEAGEFENLFFILYNRYTAQMRIFAATTLQNNGYNGAKFRLSLENTSSTNKGKYIPSVLDHAMGEFRALDAFEKDSDRTWTPNVTAMAPYSTNPFRWFMAEFPITYDPCVCRQGTVFTLSINLVEKAEIKIKGLLEQQVTDNSNGKTGVKKDFIDNLGFFVDQAGKAKDEVMKTYNSVNSFKDEQKKIWDKYDEINKKFWNVDIFYDEASFTAPIQAYKSYRKTMDDYRKSLGFMGDFFLDDKFLRYGLQAAPFIGGAVTLMNFVTSGGFKEKPTPAPSVTNYGVSLEGDISKETPTQSVNFSVPGSYHVSDPSMDADTKQKLYPYYNKKLGIFNLLRTPKTERWYRKDQFIGHEDEKQVHYFTKHNHVIELKNIDYIINPDAGLKVPTQNNAPDIWGIVTIEFDGVAGKDSLTKIFWISFPSKLGMSYVAGARIEPNMGDFLRIDGASRFSTIPMPLSALLNKKIAFSCRGKFKVSLKIIANLERQDATLNTQNVLFVSTYPVDISTMTHTTYSENMLVSQANTFQEFRTPSNLTLRGNLSMQLSFNYENYYSTPFYGYRSSSYINIVTDEYYPVTTIGVGVPMSWTEPVLSENGIAIQNILAGKEIVIEPKNGPITLRPNVNLLIGSPISYSNTLKPITHQDVLQFCDKEYIKNRAFTSNQPHNSSAPTEAPAHKLITAYPNPAESEVNIVYQLAHTTDVELYLTNALGQRVATLAQNKQQSEGRHETHFDTSKLPKGLYLYTLQTPTSKETKRLIIK